MLEGKDELLIYVKELKHPFYVFIYYIFYW